MFCDIDATEYLDDLWSRHGPHLHVNISKFEEVCLLCINMHCTYTMHPYSICWKVLPCVFQTVSY